MELFEVLWKERLVKTGDSMLRVYNTKITSTERIMVNKTFTYTFQASGHKIYFVSLLDKSTCF